MPFIIVNSVGDTNENGFKVDFGDLAGQKTSTGTVIPEIATFDTSIIGRIWKMDTNIVEIVTIDGVYWFLVTTDYYTNNATDDEKRMPVMPVDKISNVDITSAQILFNELNKIKYNGYV